jgi:L-iditol 2-dehydrogenase
METNMKSAVLVAKQSIQVETRKIPNIKDNEILIQVMAAGICGTDVHIFYGEGGPADTNFPVVLGHEFCGKVVKVGKDVSKFKPDDKVTVDPNIYCSNCEFCQSGRKQLCSNMQAIGVTTDGGFSQYCVAPQQQALLIDPDVDYEDGAMCEPVACCIHGIDIIKIKPGDRVVILGGGAIGLIMVQLAKARGASKVILSEPVAARRQTGIKVGADAVVNPMDGDFKEKLEAIVDGRAIDVVIECVGKKVAVDQAFKIADKGTRILLFSVPDVDATYPLPLFDMFKKELTVCGSFVNPDTQLMATDMINSKRLDLKSIITHTYSIDEVDQAIVKQMDSDSIKVIVKPNQ